MPHSHGMAVVRWDLPQNSATKSNEKCIHICDMRIYREKDIYIYICMNVYTHTYTCICIYIYIYIMMMIAFIITLGEIM